MALQSLTAHFFLQLASPVWHIGFLNQAYKIAQCVCQHCSRLLCDTVSAARSQIANPYEHMLFASQNSPEVQEILRTTKGKKRLVAIMSLCKRGNKCLGNDPAPKTDLQHSQGEGCARAQPKFSREGFKITVEYLEGAEDEGAATVADRKRELSPGEAFEIFQKVSDENARILGLDPVFARPEWLLWTVIPVGPPHIRPSVAMGGAAQRAQDDLTHCYAQIVKANNTLATMKRKGEPASIIRDQEHMLQYFCACLIDNQLPGQPQASQRSGKALKTIRERLVGKYGRVRGNLMGKRVDFSSRSVITADPTISIEEVGVPRSIALTLTIPERVNRYNVTRLKQLVANGPDTHPGARYIIRSDGTRFDLRFTQSSNDLSLEEGWVVERHLQDGDYVLFNRQPTLHKMSIMCHRARVLDFSTFRLNLTCTTPYNADFDGDEMNMHALQTLPAIVEAKELMASFRNLVSAQSNRPVMGIVQDTLLGARKITKRDTFIKRDLLYNIIMCMEHTWDGKIPAPAVMTPGGRDADGQHRPAVGYWTGKQVMSMIMPPINRVAFSEGGGDKRDAQIKKRKQEIDAGKKPTTVGPFPGDEQLIIYNGQVLVGQLDKKSLGAKQTAGIVHIVCNDVSVEAARDFIDTLQRTVNHWLIHQGFTVGIGDTEATIEVLKSIQNTITAARDSVGSLVEQAQAGTLKSQPGMSMYESFESLVNDVLNKARADSGKVAVQSLEEEDNNVVGMMQAGSKGNSINVSQIIACVGQQNVEGARLKFGFRHRTLPHFVKYDLGAESRGFVQNSYLKGLDPSEFYFHMMGGREGLIDTAVKTAETGYIQRRLVKSMEDLSVRYDGTVRNSMGQIVQFLYGEDGMDGRWIEEASFPTWKKHMSDDAVRAKFGWNTDVPNFGTAGPAGRPFMTPDVMERIRSDFSAREVLDAEVERLVEDRAIIHSALQRAHHTSFGKGTLPMPVPIERLIFNAQKKFFIDPASSVSDLDPVEVLESVTELLDGLVVVPGSHPLTRQANENAVGLTRALLRSNLCSRRVIESHRLNKMAFTWLIGEIQARFNGARAAGGEMCGVLAAQSIGEPATQMTLNTFHYAGVSAKNVTLGVPRLKELINVAKSIKTPAVLIYIKPEFKDMPELELQMRTALEHTQLADLVEQVQIIFDPDPETTVVEEDEDFVSTAAAVSDNLDKFSPWVLRMRLSRSAMTRRVVSFKEIEDAITNVIGEELNITYNDDNAPIPILRIRLPHTAVAHMDGGEDGAGDGRYEAVLALRDFESMIMYDVQLRGIKNIRRLYHRDDKQLMFSPEYGVNVENEEKVFDTDGTNLLKVMSNEWVDTRRTVSNDVVEILEVLGIEACRAALLNNIREVIQFDGAYVNHRHLAILADAMTFRGYLTAVSRHGINRVDNGPLQRASFEETVEILMDAAVFSERDCMDGVSENILLGQFAPIGTGHFDLMLDDSLLKHAQLTAVTGVGSGAFAAGFGADDGIESGATPLLGENSSYGADGISVLSPGGMSIAGSAFSVAEFSPNVAPAGSTYGGMSPGMSPGHSPGMAQSPGYQAASPGYSPTSPAMGSPTSPAYSPTSPAMGSPTSPAYSPTSPAMGSPTSPAYSPTSPALGSPTSPAYSPTSPALGSPTSPAYSPTSPALGSPTSPAYSPTSPALGSPTSPAYSPTSPAMASPSSPAYSPTSPAMASPSSPAYSPTSPAMASPSSPAYSPTSPAMASPSSPAYSPTSPAMASPSSPSYSPPDQGGQSPMQPSFSPPVDSPTSPGAASDTSPINASPADFSPQYSPPDGSPDTSPTSQTSPAYSPAHLSPPNAEGASPASDTSPTGEAAADGSGRYSPVLE